MESNSIINTMYITKENSNKPIVMYDMDGKNSLKINLYIQFFQVYSGHHKFEFSFFNDSGNQFANFTASQDIDTKNNNRFAFEISFYASFSKSELPSTPYMAVNVKIDGKDHGRLYLYLSNFEVEEL